MFILWIMWPTLKPSKKIMNQYFMRICNISRFTKCDVLFTGPCFFQYCINKKYLPWFSMVSWEICQGENSLFRSLSKSPFAKHLPFLGAGNLVLSDKMLLRRISKAVHFKLLKIINFLSGMLFSKEIIHKLPCLWLVQGGVSGDPFSVWFSCDSEGLVPEGCL